MPEAIWALTPFDLSDGRRTLVAGIGDDLWLFDLESRPLQRAARVGVGTTMASYQVGDRSLLAVGSRDGVVRLWDPASGRRPVRRSMPEHIGGVRALAEIPLPDGHLLAAGTGDGNVRIWDPTAARNAVPIQLDAGEGAVFALQVVTTPAGRTRLVSAGNDGTLRFWDPQTGRLTETVPDAHDCAIIGLASLSHGEDRVLASSDEHGRIKWWRLGEGTTLGAAVDGHRGAVPALVAIPRDGQAPLLGSAGHDGVVCRWTMDGDFVGPPAIVPIGSVTALAAFVREDGQPVLAAAGGDRRIWTWGGETGRPLSRPTVGRVHALVEARDDADCHYVVMACDDGRIGFHDLTGRSNSARAVAAHDGDATALAHVPGILPGLGLASAGHDGRVLAWSSPDEKPVVVAANLGALQSLCPVTLADGRPGLACAGERGAFLLDLTSPGVAEQLSDQEVLAVAGGELPNQQQGLATASRDGIIRLWQPGVGTPVAELSGHQGAVGCLARVARLGERDWLVSGGADGTVRIWSPAPAFAHAQVLSRHHGWVVGLAVLSFPDGRELLISIGDEGEMKAVDLNEPSKTLTISAEVRNVSALTTVLGPDGTRLLACGSDRRTISLIDLPSAFGKVRFRGASDRAVRHDGLNRRPLIDAMVDVLRSADETADRTGGEAPDPGPTVIAAEGTWGSGKTSLLLNVQRRLEKESAGAGSPRPAAGRPPRAAARADVLLGRPSPVPALRRAWARLTRRRAPAVAAPGATGVRQATAWFNPWAHQTSEQLWAGFARTILAAAGRELYTDDNGREWYWLSRNRAHVHTHSLRLLVRRRTLSPILAVAVFALLVPVLARLVDPTIRYRPDPDSPPLHGVQVGIGLLALLVSVAAVQSLYRYYCTPASRWLPPELFHGPLPSGVQSAGAPPPAEQLRDPLFHARAGYLYLLQHDIDAVLVDLREAGVQLVVFVDDLDRCTPQATAEVLEAINLVLTERLEVARFVVGLDPAVVAAQLDVAYGTPANERAALSSDDPSLGWTFLRKLIQLPVALPYLTETAADSLVRDLLLAEVSAESKVVVAPTTPEPAPPTATDPTGLDTGGAEAGLSGTPVSVVQAVEPGPPPAEPADAQGVEPPMVNPVVTRLERHPDIRTMLRERVRQPQWGPRDIKRLLNVWQFYVRVLDRAADRASEPRTTELPNEVMIAKARHLVLLAEIITRWPSLQRRLQAPVDAGGTMRGLDLLANSVADDIAWARALDTAGLDDAPDRRAVKQLRSLLSEHDGMQVAELAREVW